MPHPSNNKYVHHYHHHAGSTTTTSSSHLHRPPNGGSVRLYRNSYSNASAGASAPPDAGFSDETATDAYYEYYNDAPNYQNHRHVDRTGAAFSEDSGSVRLPLYESEDGSASRGNLQGGYGDRGSYNRRSQLYSRERSSNSSNTGTRDLRRVYPNPEENVAWGRMYQEVPSP